MHKVPPVHPGRQQLSLPPFEPRPVSPDDEQWATLGWPDDVASIASSAVMENGTLVIYYSTVYPKYTSQLAQYEQRGPGLASSFTNRYEIWLVAHSLLYCRDQEEAAAQHPVVEEANGDAAEERERQERSRMATLAALFAAREVDLAATSPCDGESQDA